MADYKGEPTEKKDNNNYKNEKDNSKSANGFFIVSYLQDKTFVYRIKTTDINKIATDNNIFTLDYYFQKVFQKIILDTGATTNSTVDYNQFLAFYKENLSVVLDLRDADKVKIRFEIDNPFSSFGIVNL